MDGWFSTNILGNRDGEVLDDPDSFKTKEESKLSVLEYILQPEAVPDLYGHHDHKVRINYYPPRGDNKEGWDNIDIFGGWLPDADQGQFPLPGFDSWPPRSSWIWCSSSIWPTAPACSGIQEWLSFYFKSPMAAPGLYPSTTCFIQLMKLKNTLRYLRGEDLITHLGIEYYD